MNKILEKNLLKKYPKILKDMYGPVNKTCMHFGIECGDGWYYLIDNLMHSINQRIVYAKVEQVVAEQIKEKFGTLRFYYNGGDARIDGMVELAENMSANICENCGAMTHYVGEVGRGWIQTLCLNCSVEYNKPIQLRKDIKMWERVHKSRKNPHRAWLGVDELTREDFKLPKKGKK